MNARHIFAMLVAVPLVMASFTLATANASRSPLREIVHNASTSSGAGLPCPSRLKPTALTVVRSVFAGYHYSFRARAVQTSMRRARVRYMYWLICGTPALPRLRAPMSCGLGAAVAYSLLFRHGRHVLLRVATDLSFCPVAFYLGSQDGKGKAYFYGPDLNLFFHSLAKTMGISCSDLFPMGVSNLCSEK